MAASNLNAGQVTAVPPRIAELDGLRGIAVLMVLAWHFLGEIIDPGLGQWAWWIAKVTIVGRTGVDLFFALSGFLITGIILDRTRGPREFLEHFYLRRALRILPPYFLLLGAFGVLRALESSSSLLSGEVPWWHYSTFTQTWWMASHASWGQGELSVTWSVSVEEHYYLFVPLVLMATPRRHLPIVLGAIALFSAGLRSWFYFGLGENVYYSYVFPPSRLDALAIGGLVAWALSDPGFREFAEQNRGVVRSGLLLLLGLPLLGTALHRDIAWHMYSWGHLYLSVAYSVLIGVVALEVGRPWLRLLRGTTLRWIGRISYSVYLFHPLVLVLTFGLAGYRPALRDWSHVGLAAVAFALTLVLCALLFQVAERRFMAFGRRFDY